MQKYESYIGNSPEKIVEENFFTSIPLFISTSDSLTYDKPLTDTESSYTLNLSTTNTLLKTFSLQTNESGKIFQNSLFHLKLFFKNLPITNNIFIIIEFFINDNLIIKSRNIQLNNTNTDYLLEEFFSSNLPSDLNYKNLFKCDLKLFGYASENLTINLCYNNYLTPSSLFRIEKSDNTIATTEQYGLVKINNSLNDDIETTVASSRTVYEINKKVENHIFPMFVPYPSFDLTLKVGEFLCNGTIFSIDGFQCIKEKFDEFTTSGGLPDGTIPADAKGVPWVDFATYDSILTENVNVGCAYWGYDETTGRFRTPTISDGSVFTGGMGSERFKSYRDQIQDTSFDISIHSRSITSVSGAMERTSSILQHATGTGALYDGFSSARYNPSLVARTGTETRNKQLRLPYKVRVADVFHIASDAQWEGFVTSLTSKANYDMSNISIPIHIVENNGNINLSTNKIYYGVFNGITNFILPIITEENRYKHNQIKLYLSQINTNIYDWGTIKTYNFMGSIQDSGNWAIYWDFDPILNNWIVGQLRAI